MLYEVITPGYGPGKFYIIPCRLSLFIQIFIGGIGFIPSDDQDFFPSLPERQRGEPFGLEPGVGAVV